MVANTTPRNKSDLVLVTSEDGMELSASVQGQGIQVTAVGSRDSVADVAEQLAWLGASLQHAPPGIGPLLSYADIESTCLKTGFSESSKPYSEVHSIIRFCLTSPNLDQGPSSRNGRCWHDLFLRPIITVGYPIPTRPASQYGLEIPLYMMTALTQAKRVNSWNGQLYAKGYSTVLLPTQRADDFVCWHLIFNRDGQRLSYNDTRIEQLQGNSDIGVDFKVLEKGRHILGWTSSVDIFAGM